MKAEPEDLVIVCGEVSVEIENQDSSLENEVNLTLVWNVNVSYFKGSRDISL